MKIRQLINELNYYTKLYDQGEPIISDEAWDKLYFQLQDLENKLGIIYPDSPTQKITYNIVNNLTKVKHNHKMLSLQKTKDVNEAIAYFGEHPFIIMSKVDGLTCSLTYQNGLLIRAETRGDGEIGEDITHNVNILSSVPKQIPWSDGEIIIDGEIICKLYKFTKFSDEYKDPRTFAAGSIRLLDAKESAKRPLDFIAWDIITDIGKTKFSEKLDTLQRLGFEVVPCSLEPNIQYIKERSKTLGIPIDGIVFKHEDIAYGESLGETSHHKADAIALKFYDKLYETQLQDISWTLGRTGTLTPVAIFNPIEINGNTIIRANLHNISIMKELLGTPYKNQKIKVYRANMIIPQVAEGEKCEDAAHKFLVPEICPACGGRTEIINNDGIEILKCLNPDCIGSVVNQIDHFLGKKGLDVKGISLATIEKLIKWGWVKNILDIYNLDKYKSEWINKPGFGQRSVNNILFAIENSKNCDLNKFICAIGIPLVGSTMSKKLAKEFKTWETFREAVDTKFDFSTLPDVGLIISHMIQTFDFTIADQLANIFNIQNNEKIPINNKLNGKIFCVTGSLKNYRSRDEFKTLVESMGGKLTQGISKNTTALVNNNIESKSAKNKRARELNIPIISEDEFLATYFD